MKTYITRIVLQGFKSFNKRVAIPFLPGLIVICGPNGSGKTLRGDTEILLANGDLIPIKDLVEERLKNSDKIQKTEDGIFTQENPENLEVIGLNPNTMKMERKKIAAFVKRKGDKELYEIKVKSGKQVAATASHPFMVFENYGIVPKTIAELKVGDLIATPSKLDLDGKCLDVETKLELPIPEKSFARFLGYLIGDGYIGSNRIDLTNENEKIIEDFLRLCKKFNLKPKIYEKGKLKRVCCYSKEFYEILCNLFELEKVSSETKKIPKVFLFAKKDVVSNLLAALFDCDGFVSKTSPEFEYSTKSKKLAYHVQFLLLRLGIISSVREKMKRATNSPNHQKEKYYSVFVSGIENLEKIYEKIPLISEKKIERIKNHLNKKIRPQRNVEDILPKEVNKMVKILVKELGLEVKKLRKKYPTLAAYVENRCNPTKSGIEKILKLFSNRIEEMKRIEKELKTEKNCLLEALSQLKITKKEASKIIGLNSWTHKNSRPEEEDLKKLYEFIKSEIKRRVKESRKKIRCLKMLISSDIFWDKIVEVKKVPGEEWIYDLTIPDCHNFIGNGIFVHNSNLLDAIAFALGSTSVKSLRAGKLHELIFHGGNGKAPAEIASVTLYFDNSEKIFPFEDAEISVTRKINRKGVSIYKLNGKNTTREKIVEVLAAARIYPDGHNIVLQGDVTNVIEMNPIERRSIIDEISGIAEYNEKKEKAMKDLEEVDAKLKEAEIVITERYDIFKRLEEERNAALRYQELQAQLQLLKASLAHRKIQEFSKAIEDLNKEIEKKEKENELLQKEIEAIETELEKREKGIREIAAKLVRISKKVEVEKEISYLRTKILINKDKIDSNRKEIERIDSLIQRLREIEARSEQGLPRAVKAILDQKIKGVFGVLSSLIKVPEKYQVAIEVAAGPHLNDLIVDSDETAKNCIEFLKREKIGRATFLPLNKIKPAEFGEKDLLKEKGVIGIASKLIEFDKKFSPAVEFVFGNTLVVEDLEAMRRVGIGKARMVSLDGDLAERSGAMIGGYYFRAAKIVPTEAEIEEYQKLKEKLKEEIQAFEKEIQECEARLKELSKSEETRELIDLEKIKIDTEQELDSLRQKRKIAYEQRLAVQTELNKLSVQKARIEAELETVKVEAQQYGEVKPIEKSVRSLEMAIRQAQNELASLGAVNFKAIEQYEKFKSEFDEYKQKYEKILAEKKAVLEMIEQIEQKRKEVFFKTLQDVSKKFDEMFNKMTGGSASLELEDPNNLESGLMIQANPGGKMLLNIDAMSGGEKSLTALAFLFAVQEYKPAPFYILDEVDAALDKENSKKVAELLKMLSKEAQFIVITHNDTTITYGDRVYGCTMDRGETKILGLELPKA
ncbi:MAG: LAGLIDADG family homing endonuclease [Candidatus Aenigmatarchaeota archaeon]